MSDNKQSKNNKKVDKDTAEKTVDKKTEKKKKLDKKEIFIIVFAAVALVSIIVGIVLGILSQKEKNFDYITSDLSKYVTIDEKYYNGYDVKINIPEITNADAEEEMLKLLCENKIVPEGPVYPVKNVDISVGDIVNLYYRGYTMEDGVKTYFDGGCNFSETYTALEVGSGKFTVADKSGNFIPGFSTGLIGENQEKYATLTKVESGTVKIGDLISITYSVLYADGTSKRNQTVFLDLSDLTIDERWGTGFSSYFVGKEINKDLPIATGGTSDKALMVPTVSTSDSAASVDTYFNIKINLACRVKAGDPLIIECDFPTDYQVEDLAGKKGYFETYIVSVKDYDVPELNDAFITDTLKVSADDLAKYEGENLVEKYKKLIMEELNEERDKKVIAQIESTFWDQAMANANFKKLPQIEVDKYFDNAVSDLELMFASGYASYYNNDFDMFARSYLELSSGADWRSVVRQDAETSVKQRLLFYYIVNEENYTLTDAEYADVYEKVFAERVEEQLYYEQVDENSENYEEKLEAAKEKVRNNYDKAYWDEAVLYRSVMEDIIDNANVI